MELLKIDWNKKIKQVRFDYVYNFGISSIKAVQEIVKIKEEGAL